jgi:hypothetical protein
MIRNSFLALLVSISSAAALDRGTVRPFDPATSVFGGLLTLQSHGDVVFNGDKYFGFYAQNDGAGAFTTSVLLKRLETSGSFVAGGAVAIGGTVFGGDHIRAAAATDGKVLVVWEDSRGSNRDIYGALVAANGTRISALHGFPIATLASDEKYPSVAFSGTQFLVAWKNGSAIRARRIDLNGALLDGTASTAAPQLAQTDSPIVGASLAGDGAGSWLMGWDDSGGNLQKVTSSGTLTGAPVELNGAYPQIAWNGSQWLVVFNKDINGGNLHTFGTRVNADGSLIDGASGFQIAVHPDVRELGPVVAASGADWLVGWSDTQGAAIRFQARVVNADGTIQGTADDKGVNAISTGSFGPRVAGDGAGGWLLTGTAVNTNVAPVARAFVVKLGDLRDSQTIDAPAVANHFLNDSPFLISLPQKTSKGLPITVENLTPTIIGLSGGVVTPLAKGTASIRLSNAGNANVIAASTTVNFEILGERQFLTLPQIPEFPGVGTVIDLSGAISSAGGLVRVDLLEGPADLQGTMLTITGAGRVVVRFSAAGNATIEPTNEEVVITGDSTRPSVAIALPAAGATVVNPGAYITGSSGDDFAVASIEVRLNEGAWKEVLMQSVDAKTPNWSTVLNRFQPLYAGTNIVEVRSRDKAGQVSVVARRQFTYTPADVQAPNLTVNSPPDAAKPPLITGLAQAVASGVSTDNSGISVTRFRLNGGAWFDAGTGTWSAPLRVNHGLIVGLNTLDVQTFDLSGFASQIVTRKFKFAFSSADDTKPPVVAITAPASGASALASFAVNGTATDDTQLAGIQHRLNGGAWTSTSAVINGATGTWSISSIPNFGGSHLLEVRALDGNGNASKPAKLNFSRTGSGVLAIKTFLSGTESAAGGTVGTLANGSTVAFGKKMSLSAKAKLGFAFVSWRVSAGPEPLQESSVPVLKLPMREDLTVEAHFAPLVFTASGAAFAGVIGDSTHAHSGMISLNVTSTGKFTGSLLFGNAVHGLKGSLDGNGESALTITRKDATPLAVRIQANPEGNTLSGIVDDGQETTGFSVPRLLAVAKGSRVAQAGYHTFAADSAVLPRGFSTGSVVVGTNGVAKVSGKMTDGSAFSASAALDVRGALSFGALLYKGSGKVVGNWTLEQITSGPLIGRFAGVGTGLWVKEATSSGVFTGPFSAPLETRISAYVTIAKREPLELTAENALIQLVRKDAANTVARTWQGTLNSAGVWTGITPADESPSMKVTVPKGTFAGAFTPTGAAGPAKFSGVILQSEGRAVGAYISSATETASVEFASAP